MIQLRFIAADGSARDITADTGISLLDAAVRADVRGIDGDCGGALTCASCHVMIGAPWAAQLPAPVADEADLLDYAATPPTADSRLACQIRLIDALDGMVIHLPERQA